MSGMSVECHAVVDSSGWSCRHPAGLRVLDGSDGAARLHRDDRKHAGCLMGWSCR